MLTPLSTNSIASASLKTSGSESRSTSGQQLDVLQPQNSAMSGQQSIGLDAGSILSKVNAEAATAGNRSVLQLLALTIATRLGIARRPDETLEALFLRIAATLEKMPENQRLALELKTGLKVLKVSIPDLSAALKQPDGTLAARLVAMIETPAATPQRTAAAAATSTYLQQGMRPTQAAETLTMSNLARSNAERHGLFSSTNAAAMPEDPQPGDAKQLQHQLKSLFEPGVSETRGEIARRSEAQASITLGTQSELGDDPASEADNAEGRNAAEPADTDEAEKSRSRTAVNTSASSAVRPNAGTAGGNALAASQAEQKGSTALPATAESADTAQSGSAEDNGEALDRQGMNARQSEANTKEIDLRAPQSRLGWKAAAVAGNVTSPGEKLPDTAVSLTDRGRQTEKGPRLGDQPVASSARAEPAGPATASNPERPESRPVQSGQRGAIPAPENNNHPSGEARLRAIAQQIVNERMTMQPKQATAAQEDQRQVQTMLALKGYAEVIPTDRDGSTPAQPADPLQSPLASATISETEEAISAAGVKDADPFAKEGAAARHADALPTSTADDSTEDVLKRMAQAEAEGSQKTNQSGQQENAAAKNAVRQDGVPFAYAQQQPLRETFQAEEPEEDERSRGDEQKQDDEPAEDEEARRERLARAAVDNLLREEAEPEPDLRITRDSSEADRAYALYQRMGGF